MKKYGVNTMVLITIAIEAIALMYFIDPIWNQLQRYFG
jgi:hypothetical protein